MSVHLKLGSEEAYHKNCSKLEESMELGTKNAFPGDFAAKVKQVNSQSDLIWRSSFAGPSYLTIRSPVYIILI